MSNKIVEVNDANFEQEVLKSDKITLVDFWAPWCGPCKALAPVLEELASEHADINVCKLNVDDNSETAAKYGIRGIPTIILFKNGEAANQITGVYPKQHIESIIENL